jgi:hypothetical protein
MYKVSTVVTSGIWHASFTMRTLVGSACELKIRQKHSQDKMSTQQEPLWTVDVLHLVFWFEDVLL